VDVELLEGAEALGPVGAYEDEPAIGAIRELAQRLGERRRDALGIEAAHRRPRVTRCSGWPFGQTNRSTRYFMGARVLLRRSTSRKASKADQALRKSWRNAKRLTRRAKWFNHAMNHDYLAAPPCAHLVAPRKPREV